MMFACRSIVLKAPCQLGSPSRRLVAATAASSRSISVSPFAITFISRARQAGVVSLQRAFSVSPAQEEDKKKKKKAVVVVQNNSKAWDWTLGIPTLQPEWRNMFRKETLFTDFTAGLTVGCIAVPLSLAIATASGVPPEVGLVTAAVSGVAGALMGGTTLAITGPAAAISLLVVSAVHEHGLIALPFITACTGGLQVLSGVTRLGVVAKLVPVSVIAGFTTGVGTLILTGQIPKALGMTSLATGGMNPIELVACVGQNLSAMNPAAAALAGGTAAAMYFLPKIHPKIPSALLAVGGATAATHSLGLSNVALLGSIPSGLSAFAMGIPVMPAVASLPSLCATVFLIYSMTSVESLLSCAALEKMKKTSYKHNPDQELVGQGLANLGSAFFMGMPVTSVIARSSLNVRLNAETRLPAIVQAGFVFGSVVFFSDQIAMIPMPALSGMLIMTGMGMLNPSELKHCMAVQKADVVPFFATVGGMLAFGLAEGISMGCVTAVGMNALVNREKSKLKATCLPSHTTNAANAMTWQLSGPINFMSMFVIDEMIQKIKSQEQQIAEVTLDMSAISGKLEFTGVEELTNRLVELQDTGYEIKMIDCNAELLSAINHCDPAEQFTRLALEQDDSTSTEAEEETTSVILEPIPTTTTKNFVSQLRLQHDETKHRFLTILPCANAFVTTGTTKSFVPSRSLPPQTSQLNIFTKPFFANLGALNGFKPDKANESVSDNEVRSLFTLWNDALATGNPKIVASRYASDAVLLPTVSDTPRTNAESITDYFVTFLKRKPRGKILEGFIKKGDGWCQDSGIYEFNMGDDQSTVKARYTFFYVKEQGKWKIQHHHSSVMPEKITFGQDITEEQVKNLFHLWNDALATDDSSVVADRYAKKAVLLPTVSDQPRTNREEIVDYFDNFLKLKPQGVILKSNVMMGANWCQDAGIYEFTLGASGDKVKARYSFIYVFEDGSWKIAHHHSFKMPEEVAAASPSDAQKLSKDEVRKLFDLWNDALATGDPKKVAARYAKEAVLLPTVSDTPRTDKAAIIDYFTTFLKSKPQGVITDGKVLVGENWCEDAGVYEFTMGVDKSKVLARYSFVYVYEDGEWKIAHHHSSAMPEGMIKAANKVKELEKVFAMQ